MTMPLMLDLFCGLGGASQAMRDRGWRVVGVDNDPRFDCEIHADLTTWHWDGERPDAVWASPPCTEFCLTQMPFAHPDRPRDINGAMLLVHSALRVIRESNARWWVLENVMGSRRFINPLLGTPAKCGSFYLWGEWPPILWPECPPKGCWMNSNRTRRIRGVQHHRSPAIRAKVPYELSLAFAVAVERAVTCLPWAQGEVADLGDDVEEKT